MGDQSSGIVRVGLRFWRSGWFAPAFLAPSFGMLAAHKLLGLSDALAVAAGPGERPANDYNLIMVLVFYLGLGCAADHFLQSHRAFPWVVFKLEALSALVAFGASTLE